MRLDDNYMAVSDGARIFVRAWLPDAEPKAVLVIAHGLAEHSARYGRLARGLVSSGWAVYALDQRGHGKTAAEGKLGIFPPGGFRRVRDDFVELCSSLSAAHTGAPLLVFGHSVGSLVALSSLSPLGSKIAGCAVSGVLSPPPPALSLAGSLIADLGALVKGRDSLSPLLDTMTLGANNKDFEPARTKFDWLSRDEAEVDAYAADPLCGFVCSFGLYRQLMAGFSLAYGTKNPFAGAPRNLPVYIFAGGDDPLGGAKGFVQRLGTRFKALGFGDVESRLYPGSRHETLNETNRDEVTADLLRWLESRAAKARA